MSANVMETEVIKYGPSKAFRNIFIIYSLTILSCYIINLIVLRWPIGPWVGTQIQDNFWLDNVTWQVLSLWWAILFVVSDGFPFNTINNTTNRQVITLASSWVLGLFSAKAIYWFGLGANWIFPIVGNIFFLLAFFSFAGENWIVATLNPSRKFFVLLVLILGLTYIICSTSMRWVPAWWFPFLEVGSATTLLPYLTRGMEQPGKAVTQMAVLFSIVLFCISTSSALGFWDIKHAGVSAFWHMGYFTSNNQWLLFFMVGCGINYGLPILTQNWPFRLIKMPYGGIIACLFYVSLSIVIASLMVKLIGSLFPNMNYALTYAYMGVNWSITIPLIFGLGTSKSYLWNGQVTPGSWDDVP